jgi:predicted MFS family arabinose efflux permease
VPSLSLESVLGDDAPVLRKTNFQTLLLANLMAPLGTALLSPVLDSLTGPFGVSAASIGLMIAFFSAPAVVVIPFAGVLADRYGRKPLLVFSLVLFGLAGTAIAFTTDFRVVLGLRLFQGVAYAGLTPIIITSIGDLYAETEEATAQGLRFTGSGISQAVFPLVAGVLVVISWQYPFLLYAIALPIAVVVYRWFEEPTAPDASAVADGGDDADAGPSYRRAFLRRVRHPRVFSLIAARWVAAVIWVGFLTYNSVVVVRVIGGTPEEAGLLVAIGSIVYAGVATQAGRITAFFDSRIYPLVAAHVAMGAGFALVLVAPGLLVASVGIVVSGSGFGVGLSLYRSVVTNLSPSDLRAGIVTFAEAGGRAVNTLTPIVMGAIIAIATPTYGIVVAVQLAGLAIILVGGVLGIVFLFAAKASPPLPAT